MRDWEARYSDDYQQYYYFNVKSEVSVWTRPKDYVSKKEDFEEKFDDESGCTYYFDKTMGESSWDCPACMHNITLKPPMVPAKAKKPISMKEYLMTKKGGGGWGSLGGSEDEVSEEDGRKAGANKG